MHFSSLFHVVFSRNSFADSFFRSSSPGLCLSELRREPCRQPEAGPAASPDASSRASRGQGAAVSPWPSLPANLTPGQKDGVRGAGMPRLPDQPCPRSGSRCRWECPSRAPAVGTASIPPQHSPAPALGYCCDSCRGNSISRDVDKEKSQITTFSLVIAFIKAVSSFLARREEKSHYNVHGTENASTTFLQEWKGAARSGRKALLPWTGKVASGRVVGSASPLRQESRSGVLRMRHRYLWACAAGDDSWLTPRRTLCLGLVLLLPHHPVPCPAEGAGPCRRSGALPGAGRETRACVAPSKGRELASHCPEFSPLFLH